MVGLFADWRDIEVPTPIGAAGGTLLGVRALVGQGPETAGPGEPKWLECGMVFGYFLG